MNDVDVKRGPRPLISVIVPVFKVEKYLDQCVKSIVDQTYKNLEIILVDDGSPDHCPQMCDDWAAKDSRIRVVHQSNQGQAAARNLAIEISRGALIAFVDSDDYLAIDMYETMYENLVRSGADISFTASFHVYEDNTVSTRHLVPDVYLVMDHAEGFRYFNLPGYFGPAPWDKLFMREVIGDIRFPLHIRSGDDYWFSVATLDKAHVVVYDSTPKYYYRQLSTSLSNVSAEIDLTSVQFAEKMVKIVKDKYPEQLPYALYGQFMVMLGVWDQVIIANQQHESRWLEYEVQLKKFLDSNYRIISENIDIGGKRNIQLQLFRFFPNMYELVFKCYKQFHPHRVG